MIEDEAPFLIENEIARKYIAFAITNRGRCLGGIGCVKICPLYTRLDCVISMEPERFIRRYNLAIDKAIEKGFTDLIVDLNL